MKYLIWALLWPVLLAVGLVGCILSPVVCLFIVTNPRTDSVKRLNRQIVTLPRDSLVWWLAWFDTDDNATDECWYGMYGNTANVTQDYYDTHPIYRWFCRVLWINRNSMYTFNRKFFGIAKYSWMAWQYKAKWPLLFGYYNDVNIGFKAHKGFDKLMYAGRILGIRKQNNG